MNAHADRIQERQSQPARGDLAQKRGSTQNPSRFKNNRPESIAQLKLQAMANNSPQVKQLRAIQESWGMAGQAKYSTQLQTSRKDNRQEPEALSPFRDAGNSIGQPIVAHGENTSGNAANASPTGNTGVMQRVIATVGFDPAKAVDPDPLVADHHASVQRSLTLLKQWHGGELHSDIGALKDIGDQAQPLNILGHGSPDSICGMKADDLAGRILRMTNKDKITAINLYSCSTNSKADGFAAQLKTILTEAGMNMPIKAPTGLLSIGPAESENLGTHTYPPELRQALDVARTKMLAALEEFRVNAEADMEKLRSKKAHWEKLINDRIQELLSDPEMSLKEKQSRVKIQYQNLINDGNERENAIRKIDRERIKIEKTSKENYLKDRAKALQQTQPVPGDALTEVNAILEESKIQELKKQAKSILDTIEFENMDWGDFQQAEAEANSEDEWGEFISSTSVNNNS